MPFAFWSLASCQHGPRRHGTAQQIVLRPVKFDARSNLELSLAYFYICWPVVIVVAFLNIMEPIMGVFHRCPNYRMHTGRENSGPDCSGDTLQPKECKFLVY